MKSSNKHRDGSVIISRRNGEQTESLKVGDAIKPRVLETIQGNRVVIPDPEQLVHLQFRRYAGCPVCNLHLRSVSRRHDEIIASGIREVIVFHSTRETMLEFESSLPFAVVADPEKKLYTDFGANRKMSPLLALNPRSWFTAINALATSPGLRGARGNGENTMGLPSEFLIDPTGRILALNYGKRVDDHWSVDELLKMAKWY